MPDRCARGLLAVALVLPGWLLLGAPFAAAADWSLAPSVTLGADYDSNRSLLTVPRGSAGALGSVQVVMERSTERLALDLVPQLGYQWFSDPELQKAESFGFVGAATWTEERYSLALKTNITDQNLLNAERFDTGIVNLNTRRLYDESDLTWTYAQSERNALTLLGSVQDVDFHGGTATLLSNSQYESLGANEGFIRSGRFELDVGASVGRFTSPAQPGASQSYDADVGFKYKGSERLSVSADAGVNQLTYGGTQTSGLSFDLTLTYATALGNVALTAQRGAAPSGFGELTERDAVQFSASHALAERLSLVTAVDFYRTAVAIGPFPIDTRTYGDASLSLAWRATERWTLSARVQGDGARTEGLIDLLGVVGTTRGLNVGLQAVWAPPRRDVSR